MTRAQILARRRAAARKNLSKIIKLEIRRSCAFSTVDECIDQLKVGMRAMLKKGMVADYSVVEEFGRFIVSVKQPEEVGGEWIVIEFTLDRT